MRTNCHRTASLVRHWQVGHHTGGPARQSWLTAAALSTRTSTSSSGALADLLSQSLVGGPPPHLPQQSAFLGTLLSSFLSTPPPLILRSSFVRSGRRYPRPQPRLRRRPALPRHARVDGLSGSGGGILPPAAVPIRPDHAGTHASGTREAAVSSPLDSSSFYTGLFMYLFPSRVEGTSAVFG